MQYEEKPVFKLATAITDWLLRIVVINLLIIICSLGVITIYAALYAALQLFDDYINKVETPMFKGFFRYFTESIRQKLLYGLFFVSLIGVGSFSIWYYQDLVTNNNDVFLWIGYIFVIGITFLSTLVMLYSLIIFTVYQKVGLLTLIRQSLYLAGKFFLRTILVIIFWLIPVFMFMSIPTVIIFAFIGISLPVLLQTVVTQKILNFIYELGVENKNEKA